MKFSYFENLLLNGAIKKESLYWRLVAIVVKMALFCATIFSLLMYFIKEIDGFAWQAVLCAFGLFTLFFTEIYQNIIRKIYKPE